MFGGADRTGLHVRMSSWLTGRSAHVTLLFAARPFLLSAAFSNAGKCQIHDTSASARPDSRGGAAGGVTLFAV